MVAEAGKRRIVRASAWRRAGDDIPAPCLSARRDRLVDGSPGHFPDGAADSACTAGRRCGGRRNAADPRNVRDARRVGLVVGSAGRSLGLAVTSARGRLRKRGCGSGLFGRSDCPPDTFRETPEGLKVLYRLAIIVFVLMTATQRAVAQTATEAPSSKCWRFAFGAWNPPLNWVGAGHDGRAGDLADRVQRVRDSVFAKDSTAVRNKAMYWEQTKVGWSVVLFPEWWPVGVKVDFDSNARRGSGNDWKRDRARRRRRQDALARESSGHTLSGVTVATSAQRPATGN